jgi:hypothetical protein
MAIDKEKLLTYSVAGLAAVGIGYFMYKQAAATAAANAANNASQNTGYVPPVIDSSGSGGSSGTDIAALLSYLSQNNTSNSTTTGNAGSTTSTGSTTSDTATAIAASLAATQSQIAASESEQYNTNLSQLANSISTQLTGNPSVTGALTSLNVGVTTNASNPGEQSINVAAGYNTPVVPTPIVTPTPTPSATPTTPTNPFPTGTLSLAGAGPNNSAIALTDTYVPSNGIWEVLSNVFGITPVYTPAQFSNAQKALSSNESFAGGAGSALTVRTASGGRQVIQYALKNGYYAPVSAQGFSS